MASSAILGVFPVVERDGNRLVDGLCIANVPIRQALELGAASLVVLDGRPDAEALPTSADVRHVVAAAFAATLAQQLTADLAHARGRAPLLLLAGRPDVRLKAFSFDRSSTIIAAAREAAADCLALSALHAQGTRASAPRRSARGLLGVG